MQVDSTEVGQLDVEVALRSPSSGVVVVEKSQFVDPYLTALQLTRQVAHTDNHRLHLAEGRVTHDAHSVVRMVLIVDAELTVVAAVALGYSLVALLFQ